LNSFLTYLATGHCSVSPTRPWHRFSRREAATFFLVVPSSLRADLSFSARTVIGSDVTVGIADSPLSWCYRTADYNQLGRPALAHLHAPQFPVDLHQRLVQVRVAEVEDALVLPLVVRRGVLVGEATGADTTLAS
jgi:hypothetical protein